jgi:phospholipid/cholesterol/gamma-HCH transport system permease protein
MENAFLSVTDKADHLEVGLRNDWVFDNVSDLEVATASVVSPGGQPVTFHCGGLQKIDISGAWVLYDRSQQLAEEGIKTEFVGFKAEHFKFLRNIIDMAAIRDYQDESYEDQHPHWLRAGLERVGRATTAQFEDLGFIARAILDGARRPFRLILGETIKQVHETGVRAIPIVVVISVLIGVVMAYQAAGQLEQFGAKIFVVDLVSISITREMGVLLAAALGTMKLDEEIDALWVLGLNPNQVLVVPRILGLLIALPMLTVFANIAGIGGGALIAIGTMDIGSVQFFERVVSSTEFNDVLVGMVKAPAFAVLIAVTGTLRGLQVEHSAEELGRLTTVAVVQSIFLIIVADAYFTILFSRLGI